MICQIIIENNLLDIKRKQSRTPHCARKHVWVGHVCRMHLIGGLTKPHGGGQRTASGNEAGQENDGGMTWTHIRETGLTLRLTGRLEGGTFAQLWDLKADQ